VRFASLVYECILLVPVLFLAGYLFLAVAHDATAGVMRSAHQLWLTIVVGVYFCYCWSSTGQTLALKTWRLRVVGRDGRPPPGKLALARFLVALCGAALFGVGFWWAFFDRDGLYLHDRLVGTRIVVQER
jgi:uncharacterized RDD family membrane protein YckC